jgi:S-adenosylmethionine:tRNA ribosyltransferase-isomerase
MDITDLDYELPESLIAQHPAEQRDKSRLLVVNRADGSMTDAHFHDLPRFLQTDDRLVLNNTKVIHARLHARKGTGGKVELFLLHAREDGAWEALVRPSARVKPGTVVSIGDALKAEVADVLENGRRLVRFDRTDVLRVLEEAGEVPLPPYIRRDDEEASDRTRYQTVYAAQPGAVAAPTAGLHFTDGVFSALEAKGIARSTITLHVGYGTFKPVTVNRVEEHELDPEEFHVSDEAAKAINTTRADGGRIVAVGTTATRVLESQCVDGVVQAGDGRTGHYIYPPYEWRAVEALVTNFHLPRSSLFALVQAFAGKELAHEMYRHAIVERYRFYSYGDATLIL